MQNNFRPYIIAEIGINHNGNLQNAINLIKSAKRAGANAVKFQVFKASTLAREKTRKTSQQKKSVNKRISLLGMWRKMELSFNDLKKLKNISNQNKIDFICSVFDKESLLKVLKLNPKYIKIASSDITDLYLLNLIKKTKKKVILSTGLSKKREIKNALKILGRSTKILHCVSSYPCPINYANLKRINTHKKKFKTEIGYSDHTIGNQACLMALVLGANIIEKHFTMNKQLKGADHMLSADENDLKEIVNFAKNISKYLGTGLIEPTKFELKNKKLFRKGLYFSKDIFAKQRIKLSDIAFARPETKININNYKKIIGKKLNKNKKKFEEIKIKDFI